MSSDGDLYIAEAAAAAGISKPTLLRWIKDGKVDDARQRDRNGWRVFSPDEVAQIKARAESTKPAKKA
ncbi:MerR family transcriptional regulator [Nitratireductor sp. CAU 1489]|uniref:MerR family transcriptional regulator n=1 Tax=Nitratireductor arenosus TaxID=2682096 RepID=A0A844QMY8_9HYPH|nr:MerR family transcriptional regulator [Nitratireductor arenosus]MVA99300.1 MerR family transcriptional regulator [Nitratireductor arenosus]